MENLDKIKKFFQENEIKEIIVIDGCQKIENVNKTVNSLIYLCECRKENKGYKSYYKLLNKIYENRN